MDADRNCPSRPPRGAAHPGRTPCGRCSAHGPPPTRPAQWGREPSADDGAGRRDQTPATQQLFPPSCLHPSTLHPPPLHLSTSPSISSRAAAALPWVHPSVHVSESLCVPLQCDGRPGGHGADGGPARGGPGGRRLGGPAGSSLSHHGAVSTGRAPSPTTRIPRSHTERNYGAPQWSQGRLVADVCGSTRRTVEVAVEFGVQAFITPPLRCSHHTQSVWMAAT